MPADKLTSAGTTRRKRPRSSSRPEDATAMSRIHPQHSARADQEDDDEAAFRELVFGKGDTSLIGSFGVEALAGAYEDQDHEQVDEGEEQDTGNEADGSGWREGIGGSAWVDEDDAKLKIDISSKSRLRKLRTTYEEGEMAGPTFEERLRSRFVTSNVPTEWAAAAEKTLLRAREGKKGQRNVGDMDMDSGDEGVEEEEEEEEGVNDVKAILQSSVSLKGRRGAQLRPGHLNIVRCKDANQHEPSKAVVRAVSFHSDGELLLAGGFDKTLRLFQVDGEHNPKAHSIFFADMPITNASFTGNNQAIISGRRPFFYWYDVPSGKVQKVPRVFSSGRKEKCLETFAASPDGKWLAFAGEDGYILLLSNRTKQWVGDFKLNTSANVIAFTPDSKFVLGAGADGEVYRFDIRSRRCFSRFYNEGGTATTSLSVSPGGGMGDDFTAVGSASGVVNIYDPASLEGTKRVRRPSPYRALMTLTTAATTVKFNPDGQMMAIASSEKRDALKVIHLPSATPFTNWPTERTPIRYPFALDFSPSGGFLAVGNDRGSVLLYRVRHYHEA